LDIEVNRIEKVFKSVLDEQPLDFAFSFVKELPEESKNAGGIKTKTHKREHVFLMKELIDQRTVQVEDSETNFLDIVFGLGEVTEICGLVSTGKTQICFQLCLNAQIPKVYGGAEGHALYVDTHGDFSADRITEMAKSLRSSVMKSINKDPSLLKKYRDEFQIDKILSRIHYVRILDEAEQNLLHEMLA
jgi:hypothetical protein